MLAIITASAFGMAILCIFRAFEMRKEVTAIDPLSMARKESNDQLVMATKTQRSRWLMWANARCTELAPHVNILPRPHDLDQRLAWAGKSREISEEMFRGEQLLNSLISLFFGLVVGLYFSGPLLGTVLGILLSIGGIYLPLVQLRSEAKKRQQLLTVQLPDAIELINTSVTAGLDVDRAITYTAKNIEAPVSEELQTFLSELDLGTPRPEAYRRMMWRNSSEEMQNAVGALLQGQSLGVPIADTLQSQAEQMRERRLQRAKEAGAKASPRITLIMTLFIMPSVFIVFISLLGYQIWTDFGPAIQNVVSG